jgi:hypothetical protein
MLHRVTSLHLELNVSASYDPNIERKAKGMAGGNRRLSIDQILFTMAFGRDVDYHDAFPQRTYLDRHTGGVIWIYETDDDASTEGGMSADENRQDRERVTADPDRYLEIPGLDHGDHHEILKAFLRSDWTDDEEQRRKTEIAYFGSIGGWKKTINDQDAVCAFYEFRDTRVTILAEKFLQENGIAPIWT